MGHITVRYETCGVEVKVSKFAAAKRKYCDKCGKKRGRQLARDYARRNKDEIKKRRTSKKRKLCSCGCGRPVGEGLTMLSTYCFMNKQNDEEDWHSVGH